MNRSATVLNFANVAVRVYRCPSIPVASYRLATGSPPGQAQPVAGKGQLQVPPPGVGRTAVGRKAAKKFCTGNQLRPVVRYVV